MNRIIVVWVLFYLSNVSIALSLSKLSTRRSKTSSLSSSLSSPLISQKLTYRYISIISISLLVATQPVLAQIPTFDEYNTGSGTYIKPKISSSSTQRDSTITSSLRSFDKDVLKNKLLKIKALVSKGLWDDILVEVKSISFVSKKNYGLDKTLDESIENDREELKFLIGEVSDIALASRVIYFNIEDLKGVELLENEESKMKQEEAIQEASEDVEKALKLFDLLKFDF